MVNTRLISKLLWKRGRLRRRDLWPRGRLEAYQARALYLLREHAYARSPFYRRFHRGLTARPLDELPVLSKAVLMEHFDELVTDPSVRLAEVEAHLATRNASEKI
jgi:phenylacetate-CoA ligase